MICSSFKQSPKTCKYKLFQISSSLSCAKGNKCASSPSCIGISIFSYLILFSINFCSVPLLSNGFSFNLFKDESISFSKSVKFCLLRKYSKTICYIFSTQGVTIFLYINRIVNFSTNIPPTINCTANTHYSLFGNHKKLPSE